jgi:hypothetical protein
LDRLQLQLRRRLGAPELRYRLHLAHESGMGQVGLWIAYGMNFNFAKLVRKQRVSTTSPGNLSYEIAVSLAWQQQLQCRNNNYRDWTRWR